jgi:4a-hydroxytetrahydrobiopterin dehydratase
MTELTAQRCEPCEGAVKPMGREEAERLMERLNEDWSLTEDCAEIHRDFFFKGFNKTMGFVNAVAWIANGEGHHPDLEVGWGHCLVRYTTHAIGGLSLNDFICAAKIDALLPDN